MNYKTVNETILNGYDVSRAYLKNDRFYDYLLGNNVAYYYASRLSTRKTVMDKKIINTGNNLNDKYFKTLKLINNICKKNRIRVLLFKTYKYIPEVVDNDIDLIIKKKDFYLLLKLLEEKGFKCVENETLKGICSKEGFCTIEPRTHSAFHGLTVMDEKLLWKEAEDVSVAGIKFAKPIKEVELAYLLLSMLYNPNYFKLYLFLLYKNSNLEKLYNLNLNRHIREDLEFIIKDLITENIEDKRFPLFVGNIKFSKWWYRRILSNSKLSFYEKLKHIIYFFYLKYSYIIFNKLIFKHNWLFSQGI